MKSYQRRLKNLENARPATSSVARSDEEWIDAMDAFERGRPDDASPALVAAFDKYAATRDRLERDGVKPPDDFRPGQPERTRLRLWRRWKSPELNDPISEVLHALIAAAGEKPVAATASAR